MKTLRCLIIGIFWEECPPKKERREKIVKYLVAVCCILLWCFLSIAAFSEEAQAASGDVGGETSSIKQKPLKSTVPQMQSQVIMKPLGGNIQLDKDKLKTLKLKQYTAADFDKLFKEMLELMDSLKRVDMDFEKALKDRAQAEEDCKNRNYTVQDQLAAGCQPSDTLEHCMDKLYHDCLNKKWPIKMKYLEDMSTAWLNKTQKVNQLSNEYGKNMQWMIKTFKGP